MNVKNNVLFVSLLITSPLLSMSYGERMEPSIPYGLSGTASSSRNPYTDVITDEDIVTILNYGQWKKLREVKCLDTNLPVRYM